MKHTKGPWVVFGDWGIKDIDGRIIATFEALNDDLSNANSDESFANAELIAAAPDLLEALENLCDWFDGETRESAHSRIDTARAAIEKAEGL